MQHMNSSQDERVVPAAPWGLHGFACISLWQVPHAELGALMPDATLPLFTLAGRAIVVTVWARYTGGTLRYDELAAAVLVRGKGLLIPAASVTAIWVDDVVSAEGGRRLWRIPKALASFNGMDGESGHFRGQMTLDGHLAAQLSYKPKTTFPGRLDLSGFVIQPSQGGPLRTRCTVSGTLSTVQADWTFSAVSPLSVLHGRRPLASVCINDMTAMFGV